MSETVHTLAGPFKVFAVHVTIGLDGSPPLCEMEWWIVGQEECSQSSDEELQDVASMEEDRSASQESNRVNESSLEDHVSPAPATLMRDGFYCRL